MVGRSWSDSSWAFVDRVGEGQAGDVAGQLIVGHAVVADAQDGYLDALRTDHLLDIVLHRHLVDAILTVVFQVGLQDGEVGLGQRAGEDLVAEVELVVAQGHGVIVHGVEGCHQWVDLQRGIQRRAIGGITQGSRLEVVHHRVALEAVTRVEQQGAVRVVGAFLVDLGCQLGVAHIGALDQVAVRVVVVQDGDGYDASAGIGAIAGDAPIERAIAVGSLVGICEGVSCLHPGVDRIEHVAPVADIGHVLELDIAILPGGSQELVGAHPVGAGQVQRLADAGGLVVSRRRHTRPRPRVAGRVGHLNSGRRCSACQRAGWRP